MMVPRFKKVKKQKTSSNVDLFSDSFDYQEYYKAIWPQDQVFSPLDFCKLFFKSTPTWVIYLMSIRNLLLKQMTPQTSALKDVRKATDKLQGKVGENFANSFLVLFSDKEEMILGIKDRHLDCYFSFLIPHSKKNCALYFSIHITFHNYYGSLYFKSLRSLHNIIVNSILKVFCKKLVSIEKKASSQKDASETSLHK